MANCDDWNLKASRCPKAAEGFEPYHKWIPAGYSLTPTSKSLTMVICGICFHEVNLAEAFKHRNCFKNE